MFGSHFKVILVIFHCFYVNVNSETVSATQADDSVCCATVVFPEGKAWVDAPQSAKSNFVPILNILLEYLFTFSKTRKLMKKLIQKKIFL